MFFLFLFSCLCLHYLHDLLFCLPPPPDSFIKFRSLLLRSLCLSVCAVWAINSKKIILKKKPPQIDSLLFLLPSVSLAAWGSFPQCILLVGYSYYRPQECQNCLLFLNFRGTHFAGKRGCIFDHFWTSAWHTVVCCWAGLGLGREISAKSSSPGKLYIKACLWSSGRVSHSIIEWPRLKKTSKMI